MPRSCVCCGWPMGVLHISASGRDGLCLMCETAGCTAAVIGPGVERPDVHRRRLRGAPGPPRQWGDRDGMAEGGGDAKSTSAGGLAGEPGVSCPESAGTSQPLVTCNPDSADVHSPGSLSIGGVPWFARAHGPTRSCQPHRHRRRTAGGCTRRRRSPIWAACATSPSAGSTRTLPTWTRRGTTNFALRQGDAEFTGAR